MVTRNLVVTTLTFACIVSLQVLFAQGRRTAEPAQIVTGTYGSCDPIVHDALAGAEARSPSECEIKFDADVRQAFERAFDGLARAFPAGAWTVHHPPTKPITTQARHTEKQPYRMDFAHEGAYGIRIEMAPGNPEMAEYQRLWQSVQQPGTSLEQMTAAMNKIEYETKARIVGVVNMPLGSVDTFTADRAPLAIEGARYAFFGSHVQAPTGGGSDASQPTAFIWFGRWTQPVFEKHDDGGEHILLRAAFVPGAPPLSVQNVQVRITAAEPLLRKILGATDWSPLLRLLPN